MSIGNGKVSSAAQQIVAPDAATRPKTSAIFIVRAIPTAVLITLGGAGELNRWAAKKAIKVEK